MEFSLQSASRKPCFVEEEAEEGLVSIPGNNYFTRISSSRNLYNCNSVASPRSVGFSGRFHDSRFGYRNNLRQQPHFLDSCHLCKKPLGGNRDIFMYRGDTPFCSEECRQEEIEKDEDREKKQSLSSSMRAMRRKEQRRSSSPTKSSQGYPFPTGTVGAA